VNLGPKKHTRTFYAQAPILRIGAELTLKQMEKGENAYLCTSILLGTFKNGFDIDHPLLLVAKKGPFWERIGMSFLHESSQI